MDRFSRTLSIAALLMTSLPALGALSLLAAPTPAFAIAADGPALETAKQSKIVTLTLPAGAYRSTGKEENAKFQEALNTIAKQNNGQVGTVEVLVWQGNTAPMKSVPGTLKNAGFSYTPKPSIDMPDLGKITMFGFAHSKKDNLLGMWIESKDVLMLAWGVFTPDSAAAPSTGAEPVEAKAEAVPQPAADSTPVGDAITISANATTRTVNVMKTAKPPLPTFPKLAPKPGFVRGYVYDTKGKPLAGAVIGVRSTSAGGFYSGNSAKSDAKGYYEVSVPWGAASYYCAGYTVSYGEGRAALGLCPADGEADSFASANGAIENWVAVSYGVANADDAQDNPQYSGNYYGGSFVLSYSVSDGGVLSNASELPANSEIEVTLTPEGPLLDGSKGRTIVIRKQVGTFFGQLYTNNIPVGQYRFQARLVGGKELKIRETGPYSSQSFGLEPKESVGKTTLLFRPDSAKANMVTAGKGSWQPISITLSQ